MTSSLVILLLSIVTCESSKSYSNEVKKAAIIQEDYRAITYKAISRGFFEYIYVSKDSVVISKDRNLKNLNSFKCNTTDWKDFMVLLNEISTIELTELKAPTDKRLYDGAASATLTINKGKNQMTTPSFDHGIPPEEVSKIVEKLNAVRVKYLKE